MYINYDTLAVIAQERHTDLMREAAVLHLLQKERTAQNLRQRFQAFVAQRIRPRAWQTPQAQACETLS